MAEIGRPLPTGARVRHVRFGLGSVELDKAGTVIVRFEHGIEECERASVLQVESVEDAIHQERWGSPLRVITRAQAAAIHSVNDIWGVFSRSRIALYPHQLWVCRKVNASWPIRWLVADDVGLGKTIEAGLILWPLLARDRVRRLLILCPASLVEQWQYRLRTMFDIRLTAYATAVDTDAGDFWATHHQVVASLETLRRDHQGRRRRLLESPPWDILIVDEAHHLNASEEEGPTLAYKLVGELERERRVRSMIFFTGTPHRGKNYGFLALLQLLRSDLFDPQRAMVDQLLSLPEVMIRNNKQNVTDLRGERLFQAPDVRTNTYSYSNDERRFYDMLTQFILSGKAYASSLAAADQRLATLVLIAMQKLASSSVAAIRRALRRRLQRIEESKQKRRELQTNLDTSRREAAERLGEYDDVERMRDLDRMSQLEEDLAELSDTILFGQDEEPRLRELLGAADRVGTETKIAKILDAVEGTFSDRSVLFFTEYKATQSLLMSALIGRFGEGCVTFINGDGRADDVVGADGVAKTVSEERTRAAEHFNAGVTRFLVSTEAGGEGIDLQERCHTLIHVDLPWNPMRLHQRVGRLNRIGQMEQVDVLIVRNPETVEARIWVKLDEKIARIMKALDRVMEEPEDLKQLVLGMTSPALFRELFAEGAGVPPESLGNWFDAKTASFGGRDVLETVRDIVGHSARFDFQEVMNKIPPLDLPDLQPFLEAMLRANGRRVQRSPEGLTFITPEAWLTEMNILRTDEGLMFQRQVSDRDARRIVGVGHAVMDEALRHALNETESVTTIASDVLGQPLVVCRISDRVTGEGGVVRAIVVAVELAGSTESDWVLLVDWRLLQRLNELVASTGVRGKDSTSPDDADLVLAVTEQARRWVDARLEGLDIAYKVPTIEILAVFWPREQRERPSVA